MKIMSYIILCQVVFKLQFVLLSKISSSQVSSKHRALDTSTRALSDQFNTNYHLYMFKEKIK